MMNRGAYHEVILRETMGNCRCSFSSCFKAFKIGETAIFVLLICDALFIDTARGLQHYNDWQSSISPASLQSSFHEPGFLGLPAPHSNVSHLSVGNPDSESRD